MYDCFNYSLHKNNLQGNTIPKKRLLDYLLQGFSIDIGIDMVSIFDTIDIDIRYYFGEAIDIADINIS